MPVLLLLTMSAWLITGKSYNIMPVICVLTVIVHQLYCNRSLRVTSLKTHIESLQTDKRWLSATIGVLLVFLGVHLVYMLAFHEKLKALDNAYKSIIFIPVLLYWITSDIKKSIRAFFLGSAVGGIIGGIVGTYGYFILHAPRAYPDPYMYIQAGDMSMTLGLLSLIGLFSSLLAKSGYRIILVLGAIGGIWGSLISGSRGGWLILLPALMFLCYLFRTKISKKVLLSTVTVAIVAVVTAVATPQTGIFQRYVDMKQDVHHYEHNKVNTSLGLRFNMWKGAWVAIQEKPLVGWGTAGAQAHKQEQVKEGILVKEAAEFNHVHNQLLNDWYERGLFGLLAGLGILVIPGMWFVRNIARYSIDSEPFIIATAGFIHVVAAFSYGLSQGFLEHNSGNIFYFFTLMLTLSLLWQSLQINEK